jgi:hypothetical protein
MLNIKSMPERLQIWGGIASFMMIVASIASSMIYLTGNLREAMGPFSYSLADLLYGPVFAVSLVMVVSALRDRIGKSASRRMDMALIVGVVASFGFVLVAFIRSANRQYHLMHPDLHLESSMAVLTVWATLVTGVTSSAWHFLGWALVLIGWSGWTSRNLPRVLSVLYLLAGVFSLLVYLIPEMEGTALVTFAILSLWQGFLFLSSKTQSEQAGVVQGE